MTPTTDCKVRFLCYGKRRTPDHFISNFPKMTRKCHGEDVSPLPSTTKPMTSPSSLWVLNCSIVILPEDPPTTRVWSSRLERLHDSHLNNEGHEDGSILGLLDESSLGSRPYEGLGTTMMLSALFRIFNTHEGFSEFLLINE